MNGMVQDQDSQNLSSHTQERCKTKGKTQFHDKSHRMQLWSDWGGGCSVWGSDGQRNHLEALAKRKSRERLSRNEESQNKVSKAEMSLVKGLKESYCPRATA